MPTKKNDILQGTLVLLILRTLAQHKRMHGYAINPARDFGPRLFTALAGFRNNGLTDGTHVWWIPVVAPLLGGLFGAALYDFGIRRFLRPS